MTGPARLERRYAVAIGVAFAVATAVGMAILANRFGIGTPAIVDDWIFAAQPNKDLGALLEPFFEPGGIGGGRYRPGWELWAHVQWHVLGAPDSLLAPNLFAVLRMLLVCAAVVVVPGVVAATAARRPSPVLLASLCAAAPLLIFASPATDLDFIRLGIQEPMMIGATVCGTALLIWATGRLVEGTPVQTGLVAGALAAGFFLWGLGISHKEASVAMLAGAPFVYLHLDRRWAGRGRMEGALWRQRPFQLVAAAMLAIAIAVALGANSVSDQGIGLYGAEKPSSLGGWLERLVDSADLTWEAFSVFAIVEWKFVLVGLVGAGLAVWLRRGEVPWLAAGATTAGAAALVSQGILLEPASRYLLPGMVLFGIAAILLLADLPAPAGWGAVAAAVVLAVANASDARDALNGYEAWEADNAEAFESVAALNPETCPVYAMNLDREQSASFPLVLGFRDEEMRGPCRRDFAGIVFGYKEFLGGPLGADDSVRRACADPVGPAVLLETPEFLGPDALKPPLQILGCRKFAPELDGEPMPDVLRRSRLLPGVILDELRRRCTLRFGERRCFADLPQP